MREPTITQEVVSFICHEMASPLSALLTGIDFLDLEEGASGAEGELLPFLRNTTETLRARLEYTRAALGASPPPHGPELERLMHAFFQQKNLPHLKLQLDPSLHLPALSQPLLCGALWVVHNVAKCPLLTITGHARTITFHAPSGRPALANAPKNAHTSAASCLLEYVKLQLTAQDLSWRADPTDPAIWQIG